MLLFSIEIIFNNYTIFNQLNAALVKIKHPKSWTVVHK